MRDSDKKPFALVRQNNFELSLIEAILEYLDEQNEKSAEKIL